MPPVTRRSQAGSGSGVAKKVTRKRALQAVTRKESDSWNFINTSNDNVREFVEDHSEQEEQLAIESPADVEEAVNPLREMADRVGQEVERFAVSLDAFLNDLPTRQDKYKAAMDVATEFKDIAKRRVRELEKSHQKERAQQLRKEWSEQAHLSPADGAGRQVKASSTGTLSTRKAEEVQELRHWQQEADVWELFRLMLQLSYRKDLDTLDRERQQEREEKLARLEQPHRYTTEAELYERFLVENDIARERSLIKKWLEQTIDHQESGLPGIMEELEAKSGSGKGLWSQGWMNTREHIKGEKRLRTWPSPSDSVQPQIRTSAGTDMLVTTLDPDAPSRQQRALEQPDSFYEKAMWITCWEMLRRGKPWEEIKQWCEERNEGWRAVAINAIGATDALSNGAWRKMCYLASESGCSNDYEAAVYGLLGGNAKAVEKVCRTVDDHLYANYSCILVHQFEQYLQQYYPDRVPAVAINRGPVDEVFEDKDQAQDATYNIIKKLRKGTTKEESVKPMKIIESYLINNAAEDMIYTMGMAASDLDSLRGGQDTTIYRFRQPPAQLSPEAQVVLDNHALRIAAHIYVVTRAIDEGKPKAETVGAEENVLAAYIQSLRAAGVRDSAPLYASRMQRERYILTMGNVLQDVSNPTEQKEILSLMQSHYDMDVVAIFTEQLNFILSQRVSIAAAPDRPLRILEDTKTTNLYPGQRIMEDFMPDTLEETDVALVRSLQWFELLRGQWQVTFSSLSLALRKALGECCAILIDSSWLTDCSNWTFRMRARDSTELPIREYLVFEVGAGNPQVSQLNGENRALARRRH